MNHKLLIWKMGPDKNEKTAQFLAKNVYGQDWQS